MHKLLELASRAFLLHESMGVHESIGSLIQEALSRAPVKALRTVSFLSRFENNASRQDAVHASLAF
jgi:hypothetical protein